jgi:hypothetical protein
MLKAAMIRRRCGLASAEILSNSWSPVFAKVCTPSCQLYLTGG